MFTLSTVVDALSRPATIARPVHRCGHAVGKMPGFLLCPRHLRGDTQGCVREQSVQAYRQTPTAPSPWQVLEPSGDATAAETAAPIVQIPSANLIDVPSDQHPLTPRTAGSAPG